jgi:ABC-type glycerol-3-phosphate transport system permease component
MANVSATSPFNTGIVGTRKPLPIFKVFTYAILTLAALIYIYPFAFMVGKSLQNDFEANSTANILPTLGIQPQNYVDVINGSRELGISRQFGVFLRNTIILVAMSVIGQSLICIPAAYAFARMNFPGRDLLFGALLLTIFVPSIILLVPNLIIVTRVDQAFRGLTEWLQQNYNITISLRWLNNWPALVIPFLSNTFSIFLLRQFFKQIPDELWDAARIDGTGHLRFLFSVVVPISWSPILTTVLFAVVGVWSALEWPILVTSDESWRPIAVALQQFRGDGGTKLHLLMAASVVALLPIMLLYLVTQRSFTQGISTTGLK